MSETFATPDDFGELHASELHSSLGESLSAQAGEAFMGGTRTLVRGAQYLGAESNAPQLNTVGAGMGEGAGFVDPALTTVAPTPDVPIAEARARVKNAGLESQIKLPDQDTIRGPVLDMMLEDARERAQYAAAVNRGPQGFLPGVLGAVTAIGAGMIDPVNAAAFSIPVLGEARYGMMLAKAGDSITSRALLRIGVGAAQGAVGGAALAPADWWLHSQDGEDYTYADALKSVVLSAGMGAVFHGGGGALSDRFARARGKPLRGSIEDLRARALAGDTHAADIVEKLGAAGTHLPEAALSGEGVDVDEVPGISAPARPLPAEAPAEQAFGEPAPRTIPPHPADVLADLPPAAQQDVVQAAIADVINGEPVRAGEMLQEAGKEDPRIAESIDAWHGSPHDFEAFDSSKIGTGEGSQSYGHGFYLAENEEVAAGYRNKLSVGDLSNANDVASAYLRGLSDREAAIEALRDNAKNFAPGDKVQPDVLLRAADLLESGATPKTPGTLYRVRINANPEHFLDWDKPLSEQSEHVRNAIEKHPNPVVSGTAAKWHHSGRDFYNRLAQRLSERPSSIGVDLDTGAPFPVPSREPHEASATLREAGIPGIKYLDQGSRLPDKELQYALAENRKDLAKARASGDPERIKAEEQRVAAIEAQIAQNESVGRTRNHVVFDDKLIRITHKNGEEVGLDEMKAAQPVVNNPPLRTGRPAVDAVLQLPEIRQALENPRINRGNDVPYEAGASEGADLTTNVDKRLPRQVTISGKTFDPAIPANIHEQVEKLVMQRLIAKFRAREGREPNAKELDAIYETAHHEYAEPAEDAWYRANGIDVDEVNKWWAKQDKITEHENPKDPPANLYKKPYPHNQVEGVKHEEKGAAAEWPTAADAGPALPGAARRPGGRGPRARDPQTWSLLEFLASRGGIDPADPMIGDVHAVTGGKRKFIPGFGDLVRKGGMRLDHAREAAVEAGYLHDAGEAKGGVTGSTLNDLLEAMDSELRGKRVYPHDRVPEHVEAAERERLEDAEQHHAEKADGELAAALAEVGDDIDKMPAARRARVVEIMRREGESDPLSALERAVMEEHYREAETGTVERFADHIPGWDDADDGRAASGGSEPAAPEGDARGEGDRGGSRAAGAADRSPQRAAAGRADWQALARRSEPDEELTDASREAERAPAPPETPEKAVSAAQAAAADADKLLADIMPRLTESERKTFEDALADLKHDAEARETIVRDGAACLAAAIG